MATPVGTPRPGPPRRARTPLVVAAIAIAIAVAAGAFVAARDEPAPTVDVDRVLDPVDGSTGLPRGCRDEVPPRAARPAPGTPPPTVIDPAQRYIATLVTTCGDITVALDAAHAPTSVGNFVSLARAGFYDGLPWHRASAGFVIQGGDPTGEGNGGPGYEITSEPPPDGRYGIGAVAWARAADDPPGTAGSQFFVVTGDNGAALPPDYGWIGTVTAGLDVARRIESLAPPSGDGPPTAPVYLETVVVSES